MLIKGPFTPEVGHAPNYSHDVRGLKKPVLFCFYRASLVGGSLACPLPYATKGRRRTA